MFGSGLIKGLGITWRRLARGPVTELYPYERKTLPAASRTFLAMSAGEEGGPACTACNTCIAGCPDHALRLERDPGGERRPATFTVNSGRCTFCGLCVENCPASALHFTADYERATTDRGTLIYDLVRDGRLTGEGEEK